MKKTIVLVMSILGFSTAFAAPSSEVQQFGAEQAEVEAFLTAHEVSRVTNYCLTTELNCRSVVQYRSISTGLPVDSFEDRFMSSRNNRAVSFRGFFIKQMDGTFNLYSQDKMQNLVEIDTVESVNQGITITFDSDDLPSIPLKFKIVGTDPVQYEEDTLVYSTTQATFTANTSDTSDDFTIPVQSTVNH